MAAGVMQLRHHHHHHLPLLLQAAVAIPLLLQEKATALRSKPVTENGTVPIRENVVCAAVTVLWTVLSVPEQTA